MDEFTMQSKRSNPICYSVMLDCFAYDSGTCRVLSNTNFEKGKCPFYKTREQTKEERARTMKRITSLGMSDLFEKYVWSDVKN